MKLQTIFTTMVTAVTLTAFSATAMTVSAASDTKAQITANQSTTDQLVQQLAAANAEVINLNNKINDKNTAIKDAQQKITDTQVKIVSLKGEVAKTEAELAARKSVLKKQLVSLQKQAGDSVTGNVYVDFVLNSDDLSDLIARTSTVNKLNQANKDAMDAVNESKAKLSALQSEQEAKKQTLVETKASLETEKTQLVSLKSNADAKTKALNKKINDNKSVLVALQDKAAQEDAAAKATLAKLAASSTAATKSTTAVAKQSSTKASTPATKSSTKKAASQVQSSTPQVQASTPVTTTNNGGGTSHAGEANAYAWGQCTWYVKMVAPWAGNHWGNGGQWGASAAAEGYTVNHTPSVGSIVVVAGGQNFGGWNAAAGYGHVAYVVGVSGSSITVQQGGMGFDNPAGPNTQTISGAGSYTYIHR